jgi:AcrR family transcriptional regulator
MKTAAVNTMTMGSVTMDGVTTDSAKSTRKTATSGDTQRLSARERLLQAANELFYEEGVHTVGIDRVIERAGVAKATLYSAYGSKDELIRAYLMNKGRTRQERTMRAMEDVDSARERLLVMFDVLTESYANPNYHGCAFINASAEARPGSPIVEATDEFRGWLRNLLVSLAREVGVAEPERLARQLHLLYDGANVSAQMDHDPHAAAAARVAAQVLIEAAISSSGIGGATASGAVSAARR